MVVLTRAALEKLKKEELISIFVENDDRLNIDVANLKNKLAEINKHLHFHLQNALPA